MRKKRGFFEVGRGELLWGSEMVEGGRGDFWFGHSRRDCCRCHWGACGPY